MEPKGPLLHSQQPTTYPSPWLDQSSPRPFNPTSWRSILILFTHLRLILTSGPFPSGYPAKSIYASLLSPIRATCPANLMPLDFITQIILGEM